MRRKTILIVEDEPIIAADLQDRLEDVGYEVIAVVDSGALAITTASAQSPDLVLMDIQLSGSVDGVEAALQIRERVASALIFLTSNSDEATFRRARQAQPQAFLSKPFRGRDLLHAIELAIGAPGQKVATDTPSAAASKPVAKDRLFIKVKERLVRLMFTDILYLEANDYYCKVVTENREYLATKTLKKLSAQFPPSAPFFRCHRSFVVNLARITEIGELYIFLGTRKVPLSRSKRAEILTLVNKL